MVDAAQGVEAQTVANVHSLTNRAQHCSYQQDRSAECRRRVRRQLEEILAIPAEEAIEASAKMGIGIEEILEIVKRIPPPESP